MLYKATSNASVLYHKKVLYGKYEISQSDHSGSAGI